MRDQAAKVKSTTKKVECICAKVTTPNSSTTIVLAKLFGSNKAGSGQKKCFDPSSDCVVASQKMNKKTTNQQIKPKNLNVVLLQRKEEMVPRKSKRASLRKSGRIKNLAFIIIIILAIVTYNQVHSYWVNLLQQISKTIVTACMC